MKYDGAQTDRNNPMTRRLAELAGFSSGDIVLLAGSTQEPEEAMALETFRELSHQWPQLRLVVVPRHPDRFEAVAKLLDSSGIPWQRRTARKASDGVAVQLPPQQAASDGVAVEDASDGVAVELPPQQGRSALSGETAIDSPPLSPLPSPLSPRILLVDVVGELGAWWGTAQIAFVGGSLGSRGGQNMIEPAAYGAAVSFGPNTWNFRDIVAAMLAEDAAVVIRDGEQFTQFVRRCLEQPDYAAALGNRARRMVLSQLGATEKTQRLLSQLVDARGSGG
jgi:3-deoxy-D-manno-octulosonic-acid transferase